MSLYELMLRDAPKVTCEVCGESGALLPPSDWGTEWCAEVLFRHNDPQVCADNLRAKRAHRLD